MLTLSQMRDFVLSLLPQNFPKDTISNALLNEIIYQQMLTLQLQHLPTILSFYTANSLQTLNPYQLFTTPNINVGADTLPTDVLSIDNHLKAAVVSYNLSNYDGYMSQSAQIVPFNQFLKECNDNYTADYNRPIVSSDGSQIYASPYEDLMKIQYWYYRIPQKPATDSSILDLPSSYLGELGMAVAKYIYNIMIPNNSPILSSDNAILSQQQIEAQRNYNDEITRP